jgi:trimeric autotransporter adhesin
MKHQLVLPLCLLTAALGCSGDANAPNEPTAPRTGLVAEYLFSGNANDTGGNGYNGTVSGATLVADRFGHAASAYDFDGVSNSISTTAAHFASGNLISVSLWIKVAALPAFLKYFVVCADFGVWMDPSGMGLAISVPITNSAGGPVGDVTKWHHLLATYDGTSIVSYIDGVLVETRDHPGNIAAGNTPLAFGIFHANYFHGSIDDVRIYDRVISTPAEISALYHEGGFGL